MLFLGAGFALAKAFYASGLSHLIGSALQTAAYLPIWLLLEICIAIVIAMTEMTSNTAVASITLPILASVSLQIGENPLLFMLPCTIASSYAVSMQQSRIRILDF